MTVTPEGEVQAYLKKRVGQTGGEFRKLAWLGRGAGFYVAVVFCKEDVDEVVLALTQPVGCIQ